MDGRKWDIKRAKTPLRDFVKELGLELYLDMDEVADLREGADFLLNHFDVIAHFSDFIPDH